MTQKLRHECKELKLEPTSRPELLPLRWPLEPLRKDLEERQHQPQPQQLEDRLDCLRSQLVKEKRSRKLLPPKQEPLMLERTRWFVKF